MMKQGFTLIELSIVLIIIGLLVGGIVAGSHLVESAKINATANEMQQIKQALIIYRAKYGKIPGDDNEAATRWGVSNCGSYCNGNGDFKICVGACGNNKELIKIFNHLRLSELFDGDFFTVGSGNDTAWLAQAPIEGKTFRFRAASNFINLYLESAIDPLIGYRIDNKIDDGHGNTGSVTLAQNNGTYTSCRDNITLDWDLNYAGSNTNYCNVMMGNLQILR